MDFKIEDNFDVNGSSSKKSNSTLSIVIVIIVAILCGIIVFFISNSLFGKKAVPTTPPKNTDVSLTDSNVEILYDYVKNNLTGVRSDKFVREKNVTIDSFTNEEKFYYALQFCQVEDFVDSKQLNAENQPIYKISVNTIKKYMQRFFGGKVVFSTDSIITNTFYFKINGKNYATMTYNVADDSYDTVFTELKEPTSGNVVEPFYTKLVKATRIGVDNSLELQEKVIYTVMQEVDGLYTIGIYKDFQHTILIEAKQNLTAEQLQANPINIENYLDKAATVKYTFKLNKISYYNNTIYYFDNSIIKTS